MKSNKIIKQSAAVLLSAAMLLSESSVTSIVSAKAKPKLNKKKVTLQVGGKVKLKLKNAKKKVKWKSKKKAVATVSKKGVVKAKQAGTTKIIAKSSGKKYTCKVTVKEAGEVQTDASGNPINPSDPNNPAASQDPNSTSNPSASPQASASAEPTASPGEELPSGDHALAGKTEGLTIVSPSEDGSGKNTYSFKMGNTKDEIVNSFGAPSRVDPQPQGFDAYIYSPANCSSYFQVYIQDGKVIGGATMADGFSYKDLVERDADVPSGWNSLSRYKYTESKYTTDGDAFVFAYVDTYGTKRVYGVRFISNSMALDDLMMPSNIVQKNSSAFSAYAANTGNAGAQNPISLELEEWARSYRRYSFNNSGTVADDKKFMEQVEKNEEGMPKLAQIHSTYNAINKKYEGAEETSTDEAAALNSMLGVSEINSSMDTRFKYGYFDTLNAMKRYMYTRGQQGDALTSCYTTGEMNGTNRPDAIGFLTWWVEGGEEVNKSYRDRLTVTKSLSDEHGADLDQSTFHIVGGFSYGNDTQNYTYATLDLFSMD